MKFQILGTIYKKEILFLVRLATSISAIENILYQ